MSDKPAANNDDEKLQQLEQELSKQSAKKSAAANKTPEPAASPQAKDKVRSQKASEEAAIPASQPRSSKTVRTRGLWFFCIVNFLLFLLLCAAGYWLWLQLQNNQGLREEYQQLGSRLEQEQQQLGHTVSRQQDENQSLNRRQLASQESLASLQQELAELESTDASLRRQIGEMAGRRPADWLLAEADYLVRMAGRKLWLEQDVRTAILMLNAADARLQDLHDSSLFSIRELIASDVQQLQQISQLSLDDIALTLSGLVNNVDSLPLALPALPEINNSQSEISNDVSDWQANLAKGWQDFIDNLVRYESSTRSVRPMLSQQQQWLAREQLRLALLQARAAVLAESTPLFKQSLQDALELLNAHFDQQDDGVKRVTDSLQQLMLRSIQRELPAQLDAARPLQNALQDRLDGVFSQGQDDL